MESNCKGMKSIISLEWGDRAEEREGIGGWSSVSMRFHHSFAEREKKLHLFNGLKGNTSLL